MKKLNHPWWAWEDCKAGFYKRHPPEGMSEAECRQIYCEFLKNIPRFEFALERVLQEWPVSCEQNLSDESINRIAWLGQASLCLSEGIPACFRGGYNRLSLPEKQNANQTALKWLNLWLAHKNEPQLPTEFAEPALELYAQEKYRG